MTNTKQNINPKTINTMIQANELRIGNTVALTEQARKDLFDCNEIVTKSNVVKVCGIDQTEIRVLVGSLDCEFNYDDIEPIPLTEEWFKEQGWEYSVHFGYHGPIMGICGPEDNDPRPKSENIIDEENEDNFWEDEDEDNLLYHHGTPYWNDNILKMEFSNEFGDNANIWMPNIRYVHQLQNIYQALTCKELTLKS